MAETEFVFTPTQTGEKVIRKTLTGSAEDFEFTGLNVRKFLVKNFSDGNIFVSYGTATDLDGIKIPSLTAQVIVANEACALDNEGTDKISVYGTGEVEVQALWY